MYRTMRLAAALVAALSGSLALGAPAQAQPGVVIGTLTCNVASGFGFVFGSSRAINCTFAGPGGRYEHYVGNISKFGVDIGYTQGDQGLVTAEILHLEQAGKQDEAQGRARSRQAPGCRRPRPA